MKPHPPALTPTAVAVAASKKTLKARRKLREAKVELHASTKCLQTGCELGQAPEDALKHNIAAEAKVDEATEELDVVQELLNDVDSAHAAGASHPSHTGRSGEGAKSVIRHLRHR